MANARKFRFSVQSFSASSAKEWVDRAKRVEDLGYSALHLADHFLGPGEAISGTNHPVQELAAAVELRQELEAGAVGTGLDRKLDGRSFAEFAALPPSDA